ncbi:MAG: TIGR01212 family radical SAM protein [Clostridia bacterium]|nr:TIGR01212 family radical SAM protein [Clostridia bacterium]
MIKANDYWRSVFGCKVYRLSVEGGKTCPNRDGTCGVGGCTFCAEGSGNFAEQTGDINAQLDAAKLRVIKKCADGKFIPYFQSYTATHGNTDSLFERMSIAIRREDTVAIAVATRPDCLPENVLEKLSALNKIKPVYVELGLQTADDTLAKKINRGYDTTVYIDACSRLKKAGINIITHMIIGLPNQSKEEVCATARLIAQTAGGIKISLLHVLKGTALYKAYLSGDYTPLEKDEYIGLLCDALSCLNPDTVVHRMTGDGDKRILAAPLWSADKKDVMGAIDLELKKRGLV